MLGANNWNFETRDLRIDDRHRRDCNGELMESEFDRFKSRTLGRVIRKINSP